MLIFFIYFSKKKKKKERKGKPCGHPKWKRGGRTAILVLGGDCPFSFSY
jgi:hypothetical protein